MNTIKDLDLFFVILTGRISLVANRLLARRFKEGNIEVTPEQYSVLAHLWKKNDQSQQELCAATNKDKPNITRLIDSLEKAELVQRIPCQSDRRVNLIHLTPKGININELAVIALQDILEHALQGISESELDVCKKVLRKALANMV